MAELLQAEILAGVPHGFSTRAGGAADDVLAGGRLVCVRQVHATDVVVAQAAWDGEPPEADALVTDRPGLVLAIVTADCAPVLLADRAAGVVGAAHAGWRGALGQRGGETEGETEGGIGGQTGDGVIAHTVAAMERLGAVRERIVAAIGPTIAQANYEVDRPFRAHFAAADARFFAVSGPDHWRFDLPGYVAMRLAQAGVQTVSNLARDTYAEEAEFASYRRATHRGEATGGRQISLVAIGR